MNDTQMPRVSIAQALQNQKESEQRRAHWTGAEIDKPTPIVDSQIPENETIDEKIARLVAELRSKNASK